MNPYRNVILKPITPQQCANINCETGDAIYPSDDRFWRDGKGFYYCCEDCYVVARGYGISLKRLSVKKKMKKILFIREKMGL